MSDQNKPLKIEFAPGCFDHFDGSQEELDKLLVELKTMFENLTPEELEARSRPLTEEDFDELPDDVKAQLLDFDPENPPTKRLQ
jgi:hypothetical protein